MPHPAPPPWEFTCPFLEVHVNLGGIPVIIIADPSPASCQYIPSASFPSAHTYQAMMIVAFEMKTLLNPMILPSWHPHPKQGSLKRSLLSFSPLPHFQSAVTLLPPPPLVKVPSTASHAGNCLETSLCKRPGGVAGRRRTRTPERCSLGSQDTPLRFCLPYWGLLLLSWG